MIVKNEAALLGRCLQSVKEVADEIIVVDTGSVDETILVARNHGATVVRSEWRDDFSQARNVSLRGATGRWILWLDADDVVPSQSITLINDLKKEKPDKVFGFVVRNEKPGNTGTEFIQARMFPNLPDIYFERKIHEQMMFSALRRGLRLVETGVVIEHHGYADPAGMLAKARRNIDLLLKEYASIGPDAVMAVELADSYAIAGDMVQAKRWYETALAVPGCQTALPHIAGQSHLGLGNALNKENSFDHAIEHLEKALRLSPQRVDVLYSLAVAYDMHGRKNEAIDRLNAVIRGASAPCMVGIDFREARIKSFLRLERLLMECHRNEDALMLARQAQEEMPHRPEIQNMAGRVYFRCNKFMDALHAFEKSLQIDIPNNIDAQVGLCMIYSRADKKETTVQTVNAILPIYKNTPRYWALHRRLMGNAPEPEIPAEVDRAEIDKEENAIRMMYGNA
jgi:tetratricopeptide (TPR) repeat protein